MKDAGRRAREIFPGKVCRCFNISVNKLTTRASPSENIYICHYDYKIGICLERTWRINNGGRAEFTRRKSRALPFKSASCRPRSAEKAALQLLRNLNRESD